MKKIMILGAGIYQVPLIKKAKEMGLYTIVVSYPGNYPGFSLADDYYYVDTKDSKKILSIAEKENIDAICTAGTDVAVKSVGVVCDSLHLPGVTKMAAECVTDKAKMKEAFKKGGVSSAAFQKVSDFEEAKEAAERFGYPCMMKAVDTSGSRGIFKVSSKEELYSSFIEAKKYCQKSYLLVEEYIEAKEIGIDGFVKNGKLVCMYPHYKYVYRTANTTIPEGHRFPFTGSEELQNEIRKQMELAICATGINECAVNVDAFVKDNQVFIIEIGARSGATCIPELITWHSGIDYYEQMIKNALGEEVNFIQKKDEQVIGKLLFSQKSGKIKAILSKQLPKQEEGKLIYQLDYGIGEEVEEPQNGTSRIGQMIMASSSEEEVDRIRKKILESVEIEE